RCPGRSRPRRLRVLPPRDAARRNGPPTCASGTRSRRALPARERRSLRAAVRASLLLLRALLAEDHRLRMGLEVVHEVADRLHGVGHFLQGLGRGQPRVVRAVERPLEDLEALLRAIGGCPETPEGLTGLVSRGAGLA